MLFLEKSENINPDIINTITNIQDLNLDKNKNNIQKILSQHPSFKLLTYQLIEQ